MIVITPSVMVEDVVGEVGGMGVSILGDIVGDLCIWVQRTSVGLHCEMKDSCWRLKSLVVLMDLMKLEDEIEMKI